MCRSGHLLNNVIVFTPNSRKLTNILSSLRSSILGKDTGYGASALLLYRYVGGSGECLLRGKREVPHNSALCECCGLVLDRVPKMMGNVLGFFLPPGATGLDILGTAYYQASEGGLLFML